MLWEGADTIASSRILYVEVRAALASARRARRISRALGARLRQELEELAEVLDYVEVGPGLVRLAGDLAERHALRTGDAVHLASALSLGDPEVVVTSWDGELRRAAHTAGLAVAP